VWLYGQSLFGLMLVTQSLFESPRAAAITSTVIYFGSSILSVVLGDEELALNRYEKFWGCLLFPTCSMVLGV